MKKFTFMLLTAFIAVAAMAAGPQKRDLMKEATPFKPQVQLGQKFNAKQAPKELVGKIQTSTRARAPKKAATAADFVGDYTWEYETSNQKSTDLESLTTNAGSLHVTISESTKNEGGITISGMFPNDLEATVESNDSYDYFVIKAGQTAGTYSSYGDYTINGEFYYEGDEQYEAGWYTSDIHGYLMEDGTIYINEWLCRVLSTGDYAGYYLTPHFVVGSTLTPSETLTPVTAPEGLETEEYAIIARNYNDDADVSGSVFVGFDGNDVYVQGLCTWIPDAWAKGTLEGTTITFPTGQYFGNYGGSYDMFMNVLMGVDVIFEYDAEAGTLTAQNDFFLIDNTQYYFDSYRSCVLKKVTEKATMPADPEITGLENTTYGYVVTFNVPTVDVDGDGLSASKLFYMIYADIEGEIAPLTFTPATHTRLTENMTEIPYGFTENYDFSPTYIYLNDLYSEDWNKLGIQSIYYGGDEVNATEIQWFDIKPYTKGVDVTFNFNAMDVDTSSNVSTDGDITETTELTEGKVTLSISPSTTNTPNRWWGTNAGPQLRVYSGTLTFTVPENEEPITKIVFNNGKWNNGNSADCGEFDGNIWTGETRTVVVTIAGNTQLNSIKVILGEEDINLDELETETYLFTAMARESKYDSGSGVYVLGDPKDYKSQVEVSFYGDKLLFIQGLCKDFPEYWVKATKNENGQYVIPANQYMGTYENYGYTFDYFFTAVDEEYNFEDVVLDFDAETNTFTTEQTLVLNGSADEFEPYLAFNNVVISKMIEVAATPADPEIINLVTSGKYPKVEFDIPAVDVDGNDLLTSKLAYQIWVEKDGEEQKLVLTTDLYTKMEEDMSEIPYTYDDNWDIYAGGATVYLNQSAEEIASWTKIGVQSIYYGADERRESNIVWKVIYVPVTVTEALYATFVAPVDVDFTYSEAEAFTAVINPETGNATLIPVSKVPAGTAVVVKAEEAGTYFVDATEAATLEVDNELVAATEPVVADGTQYILAKEGEEVGFYQVTPETTIAAGKGYLVVEAAVKAFYPIEDGNATGIESLTPALSESEGAIFNLAGQRISKMQKGINIVNGKKILK